MCTHDRSKRKKGRKRLILSLLAALSSVFAWQHIEGLGLGERVAPARSRDH